MTCVFKETLKKFLIKCDGSVSATLTQEQQFELEKREQKHKFNREYWIEILILIKILTYAGTFLVAGEQIMLMIMNAIEGGVP